MGGLPRHDGAMKSEEERRDHLLKQPTFAGPNAGRLLTELHRTHAAVNLIVTYGSALRDGVFGPLTAPQRDVLSEIIGSGQAISEMITEMSEQERRGASDAPPSH